MPVFSLSKWLRCYPASSVEKWPRHGGHDELGKALNFNSDMLARMYEYPRRHEGIEYNTRTISISSLRSQSLTQPHEALMAQSAILKTLPSIPNHFCTTLPSRISPKGWPRSNTRIAATSLLPPMTSAAVVLSPAGRRSQSLDPPAGSMCSVDLQRKFPESRTSKRSNSPQPDVQQLHSGFVPYWDVLGTWALSTQMAGMFALKPVLLVSGIVNSKRKIFSSPSKPSRILIKSLANASHHDSTYENWLHQGARIHNPHPGSFDLTWEWLRRHRQSWHHGASQETLIPTCHQL